MEEPTNQDLSPSQLPVVVLKDAFRNSRTERSRGSDGATLVRSSTSQRSYDQRASEESVEEDQGQMKEGRLLDLSKREGPNTADFISCSQPDTQFIVLEGEGDIGGNHEEGETEDSSEQSSTASMPGSGANASSFYKCTMCDKIFYNQQRLMLHLKKHMGVKPFACPLCPANFNTMASLQRHRRSHKTSSANIPIHTCNQCHAQFSNIQHLTEHMKIHSEKRSCLHCGIFVGGLRSLQKHMAAEHPYVGIPSKKYRTAGFQGHGILHAGGKKYLAVTSVPGNKPVMCRQCGRQFQTTSALHGHMKGHSKLYQWKPRRCRCGILLADEAEYRRHLKNSQCNLEFVHPLGSPTTLSPVSPVGLSQAMEFVPTGQTSARSVSLDSGLKSPPYTMPNTPVSSAAAFVETSSRESQQGQITVTDVELGPLPHHRDVDNDSSVSKDTVSSVTLSEQSSGSPTDRVIIKTEEWTVVDTGEVVTDTARDSDQSKSVREHRGSVTSPFPAQLGGQQGEGPVENPVQDESSTPAFERQVSHAEAASSSQTCVHSDLSRPKPTSYQRSSSSEYPGMQISSSQATHPAPSPLLNPTPLPHCTPDGIPWKCSSCGVSFEDSLMYVIHKGCHEPSSPFKCSMCGEQCADKVSFMLHFVRGEHKKPTHV